MRRIIRTLVTFVPLFLANPQSTSAQHCPFDLSAIVVLHIHTADDPRTIPGLKVSLLDSNGNTKDLFWQNALASTAHGYIDNEHPARVRQIRFPFALDHYVWVCGSRFPLGKYRVRVESPGEENKKEFETEVVTLSGNDLFSLCGTYDEEIYPKWMERDGVPYKPVEIILRKREH